MIRKIEFIEASGRDLEFVFDFFFESPMSFGEGTNHALEHGVERIRHVRAQAERLGPFPERGMARRDILPGLSFLVMDRSIMRARNHPTGSE